MTCFSANGRTYTPPETPVAVICIDGCEEAYLDAALAEGRMPNLCRLLENGWRGLARGALPSFTNVNNAAIVTGVPPSVTGLSGNFFLDPESGEEVMMNSATFLRCETILAAAARAGRTVAMVTAKEKLRDLLSPGLFDEGVTGMAFSSEKAGEAHQATHGIEDVETFAGPTPPIYSGEASVYVLRAGAALVEAGRADFLYLSLTDYIQHKYAPEEPDALAFHEALDEQLGRLQELGVRLGITADHGMNAKCHPDGSPRVVFLEDDLRARFGAPSSARSPTPTSRITARSGRT
jgi:phosphonoacetate hydrolase